MSLLSRLFGGKSSGPSVPSAPSEIYKDFAIFAEPARTEGGYRIGARIEKDGKTHSLIRADVLGDPEAAAQASVSKARQVIDEQGDHLFR